MHGSGKLVRWLWDNQLVDEISLLTYPVVVGPGTRLFPDAGPDAALDLVPGCRNDRTTGYRRGRSRDLERSPAALLIRR